jgi:hypothetical protein
MSPPTQSNANGARDTDAGGGFAVLPIGAPLSQTGEQAR